MDIKHSNLLGILYWLLGSFFPPLAIFWIILKFYTRLKSWKSMHGKVVLITGASSGLGEALAQAFYKGGCKVILASRNEKELERVKADLLRLNCKVETFLPKIVIMDLSNLDNIPQYAHKALEVHGCVDILINNAGISSRSFVENTSIQVDQQVMTVNYFGPIYLTKALLPSMLKHEGHIVQISSIQGKLAIPCRSSYSASKHALQAFSDSLRAEIAPKGMKVTVISPGYIKTNISINALTGGGMKHGVLDKKTEGGMTPTDVADKILLAVLKEEKDVVIDNYISKSGIIIRTLFPSLYFKIMERWNKGNEGT